MQNQLRLIDTDLISTLPSEVYNAYKKVFQEKQTEYHHREAFKANFEKPTFSTPYKEGSKAQAKVKEWACVSPSMHYKRMVRLGNGHNIKEFAKKQRISHRVWLHEFWGDHPYLKKLLGTGK